jgi:hypothetical protein
MSAIIQNTKDSRVHGSKTIIRVSPKSTYAMRVMLWCGVLAVLLLTYSFGRWQAAVEADASVKEARR